MSELDDLLDRTVREHDMVAFAAKMQHHRQVLGLEPPRRTHCPTCTCKEHP